ncbi:MAG: hypothetical protein JW795_22180 [Chitinivibrionales bacterium]|nr:hypothetical protein [Chitinivibrionales bacterium]
MKTAALRYFVFCFSAYLLLFLPKGYADTIPGVPITTQNPYNWLCWAAASQSILKYYVPGFNKTILQVASVITSSDEEIPVERIPECINTHGKQANITAQLLNRTLTWAEMKTAAEQKRPFIVLLKWVPPNYHCNVYAGFLKDSTKIRLMDPLAQSGNSIYSTNFEKLLKGTPGTNFGSLGWYKTIMISGGTSIGNPYSNHMDAAKFRIVGDGLYRPNMPIELLFTPVGNSTQKVRIVNAMGTCFYESIITSLAKEQSLCIDVSLPAGAYIATLAAENNSGKNHIEQKSFIILH